VGTYQTSVIFASALESVIGDLPVRSVNLLASSYSGSTLLSMMLGADKRIVGFANTYHGPHRRIAHGYRECRFTCGTLILECPFRLALAKRMVAVGEPGYAWIDSQPAPRFLGRPLRPSLVRPITDVARRALFRGFYRETTTYFPTLEEIGGYEAYFDGCKSITRVELFRSHVSPPWVVRLVKDPRAFVYSPQKAGKKDLQAATGDWLQYNSAPSLRLYWPRGSSCLAPNPPG